jgi:hypothetical protein
MAWTRKLTPPIQLKDSRQFETLADVRELKAALRAAPPAIGRKRLADLDQRQIAEALAKPADGIVAAQAAFGADQSHARDAAGWRPRPVLKAVLR